MRNCYLTLALFVISVLTSWSQALQSAQLIHSLTPTQIDSFLTANGVPSGIVPIRNGLDVYRITYNTISYDSSATIATGTLFLPQGSGTCKKPIFNYCHGTIIKKADAPSYKVGEYVIGICFGANGMITTMPDYLGLGPVSPGLHPYIHAHSEATASIHMIRSSKYFMDSLNYNYSDQLFLSGYSQGGHASMATHKMMEEHHSAEFPNIVMSAPLSGPYDVSGVQAEVITKDSSYGSPGYLPFVIFSYNMVYNMYSNWDAVLDTPYNTVVPPLMDGSVGLGTVENFIPDTPNLILLPALLDSFENFPNHPFRQVLALNNLWDWVPNAPVRMGYCESDELVSYKNAIACRDSMIARGATDVQAFSANSTLSHSNCALFALLAVNGLFTPLREDLITLNLTVTHESAAGAGDGAVVSNVTGWASAFNYLWSNNATTSNLTNVDPGQYTLTVTDSNGCSASSQVAVGTIGIENIADLPNFVLYPNPAKDQFTIRMANFTSDADLAIVDLMGKVVINKVIPAGTEIINIGSSMLSKGVYLVKIGYGNLLVTKRVIIE